MKKVLFASILALIFMLGNAGAQNPWVYENIGSPPPAGNQNENPSSGSVELSCYGESIGGTADLFGFYYQESRLDVEIVAQVNSITGTNPRAEGGLMIRMIDDNAESSPFVSISLTRDYGLIFTHRGQAGQPAQFQLGSAAVAPVWLKLVKSRNTIAGYYSYDAVDWFEAGQTSIVLGAPYRLGIFACGGESGSPAVVNFGNISIFRAPPQRFAGSDLLLWLRPDHGVIRDETNRVMVWQDQSGYGRDAVQSNPVRRPEFITGEGDLNGSPRLRFAGGSSHHLLVTNSEELNPSAITIAAVVKRTAGSSEVFVIDKYQSEVIDTVTVFSGVGLSFSGATTGKLRFFTFCCG